jgi:hypothetical protein
MARDLDRMIAEAAARAGIPEEAMRRYVQIESGGNPAAVTGSYRGLLMLSPEQLAKYGGGDIHDPATNLNAGAAKLAEARATFSKRFGRDPTPAELYMVHQQGWGGYQAHAANPDRPAWQSMASTKEGREKGEKWAQLAIAGNMTGDWKNKYDPRTITSGQFLNLWAQRVGQQPGVNGGTPAPAAPTTPSPAAPEAPDPALLPPKEPEKSPTAEALSAALKGFTKAFAPPRDFTPLQTRFQPAANSVAVLGSAPVGTMVGSKRA